MQVHLSPKSSNKKTGPIPVSTISMETCPNTCPFNSNNEGGCYASSGPLFLHWRKVTEGKRGDTFEVFLEQVQKFPEGQLWRHAQAGDLPGDGKKINKKLLNGLVKANKGKKGFTYTHYDVSLKHNLEAVQKANKEGFTVNLSCNGLDDMISKKDLGLPLTTVLSSDIKETAFEYKGIKVAVCPATYKDDVDCLSCQLCQKRDRKVAIGFPAHGTSKKRIDNYLHHQQ